MDNPAIDGGDNGTSSIAAADNDNDEEEEDMMNAVFIPMDLVWSFKKLYPYVKQKDKQKMSASHTHASGPSRQVNLYDIKQRVEAALRDLCQTDLGSKGLNEAGFKFGSIPIIKSRLRSVDSKVTSEAHYREQARRKNRFADIVIENDEERIVMELKYVRVPFTSPDFLRSRAQLDAQNAKINRMTDAELLQLQLYGKHAPANGRTVGELQYNTIQQVREYGVIAMADNPKRTILVTMIGIGCRILMTAYVLFPDVAVGAFRAGMSGGAVAMMADDDDGNEASDNKVASSPNAASPVPTPVRSFGDTASPHRDSKAASSATSTMTPAPPAMRSFGAVASSDRSFGATAPARSFRAPPAPVRSFGAPSPATASPAAVRSFGALSTPPAAAPSAAAPVRSFGAIDESSSVGRW